MENYPSKLCKLYCDSFYLLPFMKCSAFGGHELALYILQWKLKPELWLLCPSACLLSLAKLACKTVDGAL